MNEQEQGQDDVLVEAVKRALERGFTPVAVGRIYGERAWDLAVELAYGIGEADEEI